MPSIATSAGFCLLVLVGIAISSGFRNLFEFDAVYAERITTPVQPPYPNNKEENVFWFVQLSDIHVSRYYDVNRSIDLQTFCSVHLPFINPALVLITGDLTDAKTADFYSSKQYLDEWQTYQKAVHASGALETYPFLDIRGNHDGFDTPMKKGFDSIYKSYSISNTRQHAQHPSLYVHQASFGNYSFIAVDSVPRPGPKRPFNFFGIIDEERLAALKRTKRQAAHSNHTVFYGHYPSAMIHQPYPGALTEVLRDGVAYLSGHLHDLVGLGPHLYAQQRSGQLELELADWKDNRRLRILAFDHDLFSFSDYAFNQFPIVLITNPKNVAFAVRDKEPLGRIALSSHIRMLIFSPRIIQTISVFIDGKLVGNARPSSKFSHLYVLPWTPAHYADGLHTISVEAADTRHQTTASHSFSLDDSVVQLHWWPTLLFRLDLALMLKLMFIAIWSAVLLLLVVARWRPHFLAPPTRRRTAWFSTVRRGLCLFGSTKYWWPVFTTLHVYYAFGPVIVAGLLTDHYGVVFVHGVLVEGCYLPGSLTFLYGFIQVLLFHTPLLLHFCLRLSAEEQQRAQHTASTSSLTAPGTGASAIFPVGCRRACVVFSPAVFALLCQANSCLAMYRAYGITVLLLGPGHSWLLVLGALACCYPVQHSHAVS